MKKRFTGLILVAMATAGTLLLGYGHAVLSDWMVAIGASAMLVALAAGTFLLSLNWRA